MPIKLTADRFSLPMYFCFFFFGYPLFFFCSSKGCPLPDCGCFGSISGSVLPAQGHKKLRKTCTTPETPAGWSETERDQTTAAETSHILSRWDLLGMVRSRRTWHREPSWFEQQNAIRNRKRKQTNFNWNRWSSEEEEEGQNWAELRTGNNNPTGYAQRFVIWALHTYETMIRPWW